MYHNQKKFSLTAGTEKEVQIPACVAYQIVAEEVTAVFVVRMGSTSCNYFSPFIFSSPSYMREIAAYSLFLTSDKDTNLNLEYWVK